MVSERPRLSGRVVSFQADGEEENGGRMGSMGRGHARSKRQKRKGQGRAGKAWSKRAS